VNAIVVVGTVLAGYDGHRGRLFDELVTIPVQSEK
jgi:hypothetical protein